MKGKCPRCGKVDYLYSTLHKNDQNFIPKRLKPFTIVCGECLEGTSKIDMTDSEKRDFEECTLPISTFDITSFLK